MQTATPLSQADLERQTIMQTDISTPNKLAEEGFPEPRDLTECTDSCDVRKSLTPYSHLHAACCGAVKYAEGGGGDDGRGIGGYSDAIACAGGCGELLCDSDTRTNDCRMPKMGDKAYCDRCFDAETKRQYQEAALFLAMAESVERIKQARDLVRTASATKIYEIADTMVQAFSELKLLKDEIGRSASGAGMSAVSNALRLVRALASETTHASHELVGKWLVTLCGQRIEAKTAHVNDGHVLNCGRCVNSYKVVAP